MLSEKHRLTESFIIKGTIDSVSKINYDLIRNHLFSNYSLTNRFEDESILVHERLFKSTISSTYTMDQ